MKFEKFNVVLVVEWIRRFISTLTFLIGVSLNRFPRTLNIRFDLVINSELDKVGLILKN